ncbi:unnamed protein product, partial [marine sediment metagenome]
PRFVGRNGSKIWVTDGRITCEALIFGSTGLGGISKESVLDLAYAPSINKWGGVRSIQLNLEDVNLN